MPTLRSGPLQHFRFGLKSTGKRRTAFLGNCSDNLRATSGIGLINAGQNPVPEVPGMHSQSLAHRKKHRNRRLTRAAFHPIVVWGRQVGPYPPVYLLGCHTQRFSPGNDLSAQRFRNNRGVGFASCKEPISVFFSFCERPELLESQIPFWVESP